MSDEVDNILGTLISNNVKDSKASIRLINILYDQHFVVDTWAATKYSTLGTMSKYFRTSNRFEFHRVAPGKHLVSITKDFKFKKYVFPKSRRSRQKKRVKRQVGSNVKRTLTPSKARKVYSKPSQHKRERERYYVTDDSKKEEKKPDPQNQILVEENKKLKIQLEDIQKKFDAKELDLKKQSEDNLRISMEIESAKKKEEQLLNEITKLKDNLNNIEQSLTIAQQKINTLEEEARIAKEEKEKEKEKQKEKEVVQPEPEPEKVEKVEEEKPPVEKVEPEEPPKEETPVEEPVKEPVKEEEKKPEEEKPVEEKAEGEKEEGEKEGESDDEGEEISFLEEYHTNKCELISPKEVEQIKKGENNKFAIKCPNAVDVSVIVDDDNWNYLVQYEEGVFEGEVKIETYNSFIDIFAKWGEKSKFMCICTINIGEGDEEEEEN